MLLPKDLIASEESLLLHFGLSDFSVAVQVFCVERLLFFSFFDTTSLLTPLSRFQKQLSCIVLS